LKSYISIVYDKVPILECLSAGYAGFGTWLRAVVAIPAQTHQPKLSIILLDQLMTTNYSHSSLKYLDDMAHFSL